MYLPSRSDGVALPSPRLSRAGSVSSERPSLAGSAILPLHFSVHPPPAYVAVAAASQIVTDYHNAQLRAQFGSDASPSPMEDGALFSEEALALLNAFLDYLLLSFLSVARSSSLSALKSAVVDVLKAKLAREAIASAEEELQDLSGGGEDEEESVAVQNGISKSGEWNLELTWKRTRLRIMVYTRLGEMEDEDEELYLGQDEIFQGDIEDDDDGETAQEKGLVSWAAAIFLTAVIEYLAEQTLVAAGQAAYARASAKQRSRNGPSSQATPSTQPAERVVVEEHDAEKVALNPALGRLWRTWKKQLRSSMSPSFHTPTRELKSLALLPLAHHAQRKSSASTLNGSAYGATSSRPASTAEIPEAEPSETDIAANIPIPTPANDVAEIEVPGLAREIDKQDSGASTPTIRPPQRPASVIHLSSTQPYQADGAAPPLRRLRSNSVPARDPKPMEDPADADATETVFATPMETGPERKSYVDETKGSEDAAQHGVAAGVLAGATSLVATAIASVVGVRKSEEAPSDHDDEQPDGSKPQASIADDDEKAEVLDLRRVSVGVPPTPPEVVRNTSRHSSQSSRLSSQGFPITEQPIDEPAQAQDVDNDIEDPEAIGVARTSNVPVPAPRSLTPESSKSPFVVGAFPSDEGNAGEPPAKNEKRSPRRYSVSPPLSPVDTVRSFESAPASGSKPRARPQSPSSQTSSLAPLQDVRDASGRAHYDEAKASQDGYGGLPHDVYVIGQPISISSIPEKSSKRRFRNSAASGSSVGSIQTGNMDKPAGPHPLSSKYSPDSVSSFATPVRDSTNDPRTSAGLKAGTVDTEAVSENQEPELHLSSLERDVAQYPLESEVPHELQSSIPPLRVNKPENSKPVVSPPVNPPVGAGQSPNSSSTPSIFPARTSSRSASTSKAPAGVVPSKSTTASSSVRPQPGRASSGKSGLEAREPRIQTESMRDFADFIRSTGPDRELLTTRPFVSNSTSEIDMTGAAQGSSIRSGNREPLGVPSSSSQPNPRPNEDAAPPTGSARRKLNLEPRGGAAATKSETADLIDFIRQGPPGPADGRHRISRTVAPFRTTMDSDELNQLAAEQNPAVTPNMPQANSTASKHSAPASANSRTNLIGAPTTAQITFPTQPQRLTVPGGEPQLVRKRYRVKDPYAIDTDDEEDENDDMLAALPKSGGRQEESLIDFLRNVEPPAEKNTPKPVLGVPSAKSPVRPTKDKTNGKATSDGSTKHGAPPVGAALPSHPAVISSNASGGSAPQPKNMRRIIEARDARTDRTATYQSTNDLADFLRSSGPPEPAAPAPAPPAVVGKPEGKKGGKFWRRKTYLDMP